MIYLISYKPPDPGGGVVIAGESIVDFGATPLSMLDFIVTGQANILAGASIYAWMQATASTADNDEDAHLSASYFLKITASDLVPGTGFTLRMISVEGALTGEYRVNWTWINP